MTTIIRRIADRRVLAVFLIVSSSIGLLIWGALSRLDAAQWAAWVQAFGSIAAICVAFWIARSERQAAKGEALTLAMIAAADVLIFARQAQVDVTEAIHLLDEADLHGFPIQSIMKAAEAIAQAGIWNRADLAALIPLPNGCAMSLAKAQFLLSQTRSMLNVGIAEAHYHGDPSPALRAQVATTSREFLRMAVLNLDNGVEQLNNAAKPAEYSFGQREN